MALGESLLGEAGAIVGDRYLDLTAGIMR